MLYATASQTVGPYLHIGLNWLNTQQLAPEGVRGERISIEGRLLDADRAPVPDGMIEIWQANSFGRYAHPEDTRDLPLEPGFTGFGRAATDAAGSFRFDTIKPGRVPGPGGVPQAPHIVVSVFARGILKRMVTRLYFPGEASNDDDPVLALVPSGRRATLIAQPVTGRAGVVRFDILLQGPGETVFFEL